MKSLRRLLTQPVKEPAKARFKRHGGVALTLMYSEMSDTADTRHACCGSSESSEPGDPWPVESDDEALEALET